MSILDETPQPPSPAEQAAGQLKTHLRQTYRYIVAAFTEGSQLFWSSPHGASPAEIAAALGTDAKEIFELHWQLGQFIASVRPEAVQPGLGIVGNFTINEDGTVTVLPPEPAPEPEPEPEPEPSEQ
jgi:hypothetical protein